MALERFLEQGDGLQLLVQDRDRSVVDGLGQRADAVMETVFWRDGRLC